MKTDILIQLRDLVGAVSTAMVVTKAQNDLLRARATALAGVEESGRIWLALRDDDGCIDEVEREPRVHLVIHGENSFLLSVNGIATVASDRNIGAKSWDAAIPGWMPKQDQGSGRVLIFVDPRNVECWNGGAWDTVVRMFRVAKAYVTRQPDLRVEYPERGLLAA